MKTELVIFDLDGTLLNTLEDLKEAVNVAMRLHGFPLHTSDWVRANIGHGVANLVREAVPERFRDSDLSADCLPFMISYYSSHLDVCTRPYPGMQDLVHRLCASGIRLAVCSNKFEEGAKRLIEKFYPEIEMVFGASEDMPLKPDPRLVEMICAEAGVPPRRTVMVGDSATDMLTAANAGIAGIAVSWGFRDRASLEVAPRIADDAAQLEMMLTQAY